MDVCMWLLVFRQQWSKACFQNGRGVRDENMIESNEPAISVDSCRIDGCLKGREDTATDRKGSN